jgi:hypothetical protein
MTRLSVMISPSSRAKFMKEEDYPWGIYDTSLNSKFTSLEDWDGGLVLDG